MPVKKVPAPRTSQATRAARKREEAAAAAAPADQSKPVPFKVTAFAAAVLPLPAISDAVEDEPVFDRSKATPVAKRKKA